MDDDIMIFEKIEKWNAEFLKDKRLAQDSNLQKVINYLGRIALQNLYVGMLSEIITQFIILGFMAGRESAKRESVLEAFVSAESEEK